MGIAATNETASGLQSVLMALNMMDCFTTDEQLGVSELARRLGVAKSTAHRLLTTLCSRGFAERDHETGRYRLGLRLYELGTLAISRSSLRCAAMPLLEELRERTGHTVHFGVVDGVDVVYLERLETLRGMPLMTELGRRFPLHSTASGKAIAAFDPLCAEARRIAGFPACTQNTVRGRADFDREIELIRTRGYARNRGETRSGLSSIAAPVRDGTGRALAAFSIVAPTADAERNVERHGRLVRLAASRLARAACA